MNMRSTLRDRFQMAPTTRFEKRHDGGVILDFANEHAAHQLSTRIGITLEQALGDTLLMVQELFQRRLIARSRAR